MPMGNNLNNNASTGPGSPGRRVGEWVLEKPLGTGSFGEVWQARHHVWTEQLAAVKLPTHVDYVRSLQREGAHAHRLEHPGIVRPLGMDPFAKTPYLVMEFVPGLDLRRLLRERGRLDARLAVDILRQVLSALAHAHAAGIVHRDIKPENILLHERGFTEPDGFSRPGTVKVTDFGLGIADLLTPAAGQTRSIVFSTDTTDADAQQIAGSLDYMAPEQRQGAPVDPRADLFACGVVLFEMLTGERPEGTEVPSDLHKGVPAHLDDAFRRSYARLENRFADAAAFLQAIGNATPVAPPRHHPTAGMALAGASAPGACPSCHGRVEEGDQFCMHCGHQLVGLVRRCGKCGAFPALEDNFCMFCGDDLRPADGGRLRNITA